MKLAICKIGANITFSRNNKSAANADILYFLRQLDIGEHDVTICTRKTRNTLIPKRMKFQEIRDVHSFDQFDLVLVFNGSYNFFGGAVDFNMVKLYEALHNTVHTRIVWCNTDGQLPMKQLWPLICKRVWAQQWNQGMFHIPDKQVAYLTQGRHWPKMNNLVNSKPENIVPEKMVHIPFYKMILAKHEKYIKPNPTPFEERPFEIGFGGATRNTHKRNRIQHYFDRPDAETLLFGNLRGVSTYNTVIQPKVSYQDFIRMMWKCKSTVIIGDVFYEDNFFTLRMYESLLADNIMYIDSRLDINYEFYGRENEWLYINTPEQISFGQRAYDSWSEIRNQMISDYNYDQEKEMLVAKLESLKWR